MESETVHVYPNPGKHRITLDFTPSADRYSLGIIDAHGKVIRQWKPMKKSNERKILLNVAALPSGTYTLRLYNEHTTVFKRILIAH